MDDKSQEEESREARVIHPFEKRFNIPLPLEDIKQRFMNRIWNGLNQEFDLLVKNGPFVEFLPVLRHVADGLGVIYDKDYGFAHYAGNNFYKLLNCLEFLYEGIFMYKDHWVGELESIIIAAINQCEIDIGIEWKDGIFQPSGAKLFDEKLVDEPMRWLADPKYKNVLQPFQKGLKHYLEATKDPSKLPDTVTDMYEALEALARIVNGNDRNLSANAVQFVDNLGLSEYYAKMLNEYCQYAHQYRHAVRQAKGRIPPKPQEVEAFIYTTGLFIRLAIHPS
jgi:hypothetical protein